MSPFWSGFAAGAVFVLASLATVLLAIIAFFARLDRRIEEEKA